MKTGLFGKGSRIRLTIKLKKEKNHQNKEEIIKIEADTSGKEIWNKVKMKAGWLTNLSPTTINNNGSVRTSPLEIANIMNKFFINKVNTICESLVNKTGDLLQQSMNNWKNRNNLPTFNFKTITPIKYSLNKKI